MSASMTLTKKGNNSSANLMSDLVISASASGDAVCNFWKEFNLEGYRSKLDEAGIKVAGNQEASLENRRALAEKTKDFRKQTSPEVFKAVSGLIKAYQEEIDRLNSRAKFGEASFLEVYQKLYEAPDPAPALSSALDMAARAADAEAQLVRVAAELAEYKSESAELQNQTHTIRALQEKVRTMEAQLQEKDRQLKEAADHAAAAETSRMLAEVQERENRLAAQLSEAHSSMAAMKALHAAAQNQLFTIQSKTEEEQISMQHELDLTTEEFERAQERVMALEQEKAQLVQRLEHISSSKAIRSNSLAADGDLLQQLQQQREISARLQGEAELLQRQLEEESVSWSARCNTLQAALDAQEAKAAALEQQISARPTNKQVDELQQQVRMLQTLAGYVVEEPSSSSGGASGAGEAGTARGEGRLVGSLEVMLLDKNRHLEHDLTMARLQLSEAQGSLDAAHSRLSELEGTLDQHKQLVLRLEEDLLAAQQGATAPNGTMGRRLSAEPVLSTADAADGEEGQNTMVKVLCSQRDRLRQRCRQLEEENQALVNALGKAKKDVEAARADNVALVERLRYVQGYTSGQLAQDPEAGNVETKYNSLYETKVDPFTKFRDKEREVRKKQMSIADRAMYLFGQLINSSKFARTMVFLYTVVLHALVFLMMMHSAHRTPIRTAQAICGDYCQAIQQQQQALMTAHAQLNSTTGP